MIDENLLNVTEKIIDFKISCFIECYVEKWFNKNIKISFFILLYTLNWIL